jgi:hypothetical protein
MSLRWYAAVVDCHDIAAQARWWAETLDYVIVFENDAEVAIIPRWARTEPMEDIATFRAEPQGMIFVQVPEDKTVKNRLHIDLAPHTSQDRDVEIERLLARGATHVDIGQGDSPWTVLADPEGNEFCVLSARPL